MTAKPRLSKALAELIEAQARDDAADRISTSAMQESQIGESGDPGIFASMPDPRALPADARLIEEETYLCRGQPMMAPPVRVIGAGRIWTREITQFRTESTCPVCHNRPLRRAQMCLCCHATAADPTRHPMQEPPKAAAKREKLKGGKGATLTPGKRGRKGAWADYFPVGKV